eukprot:120841_1
MSLRCHSCKKAKKINDFSRNQLKKYGNKRRCNQCIQHKRQKHGKIWTISELKSNGHGTQIWKIEALCIMKIIDQNVVHIVLMDKYQTEITVIFSGHESNLHYMGVFKKNNVYSISNGALLMIGSDNSSIGRKGDTCIMLFKDFEWHKVSRLYGNSKQQRIDHRIQKCKFVQINEIQSNEEQFVDVTGVVISLTSIYTFHAKDCNNEKCMECGQKYRDILIQDKSGQIQVKLWNEDAHKIEWKLIHTCKCVLVVTLRRCQKLICGVLSATGIVEIEKMNSHELEKRFGFYCSRCCSRYNLKYGRKCNECNRINIRLKVCKQCKCTYYCNKKCQKRSWNRKHRGICHICT